MIKKILLSFGSLLVTFLTFKTSAHWISFLSNPLITTRGSWITFRDDIFPAVLIDLALLCVFICQHSLMACTYVKRKFEEFECRYLERSVYLLGLYVIFQHIFLKYWIFFPNYTFWHLDTSASPVMWWLFVVLHGLIWTMIYTGIVIMDLPEFLGLKQIVYYVQDLPEPLSYKSSKLRRLLSHQRHPCLIGFCIILWVYPCMTLDRLILAVTLTVYMMLAWKIDKSDIEYQKTQMAIKDKELLSGTF